MTRANDDAAEALGRHPGLSRTLAAHELATLREALKQADIALREAEQSKLPRTRSLARDARITVTAAWGIVA